MFWALAILGCASAPFGAAVQPSVPEPEPTQWEWQGPRVPALPALWALQGSRGVLLWTDRSLGSGEWVERLDEADQWVEVGASGDRWVDDPEGVAWRVRRQEETGPPRLPEPIAVDLQAVDIVAVTRGQGELTVAVSVEPSPEEAPPLALRLALAPEGLWLAQEDGATWEDDPVELPALTGGLTLPATGRGTARRWLEASLVASGVEDGLIDLVGIPLYEFDQEIAWGDPHVHSNLSKDGCEDPSELCGAWEDAPGSTLFGAGASRGLAFAVISDHAEYDTYTLSDEEGQTILELGIFEEAQALVDAAGDDGILALPGYEWTANYGTGGHRTVVFDRTGLCEAWWIPAYTPTSGVIHPNGFERYSPTTREPALLPSELAARLGSAASQEGCGEAVTRSWFHHPAYAPPIPVDWTSDLNTAFPDTVVEILSEHGSSECDDLDASGCLWRVNAAFYKASGAVRNALTLGWRLGFVGGSDSHASDAGSALGEPSWVSGGGQSYQHLYPGALTGILRPFGSPALGVEELFEAIDARRTLASSWDFQGLRAAVFDEGGNAWLPGADIPSGMLTFVVVLDDDQVEDWLVELIDPADGLLGSFEGPVAVGLIELEPGDAPYLRVRAWVEGVEQRAFFSPFFGI